MVRFGEDSALAFAEVVLAGSRIASDSITPPVVPLIPAAEGFHMTRVGGRAVGQETPCDVHP